MQNKHDKDMSLFINAEIQEAPEVEVEGISTFLYPEGHEKAGQKIPFIMRRITSEKLREIGERNTSYKTRKGRRIKTMDEHRTNYQIAIETIIYPNFKDKDWLDKYKLLDPVDLFLKVINNAGELANLINKVLDVNGFDETDDELVDEAKN